jgi:hypothetical protein
LRSHPSARRRGRRHRGGWRGGLGRLFPPTGRRRLERRRAPGLQRDQVTFNSAWKNHDAFVAHTKEPVYQEFLKKSGDLFVQAVPGQTTHPYMTTSVLKRFAGFLRKEAFVG